MHTTDVPLAPEERLREIAAILAAVTATAIKLCHVTWRIMTDRRDDLRQRPTLTP